MTRTIFIAFVISSASLISANNNQPKYPVCVIGAGISGVNLGILLQARGYDVHIFEKLPKVGGKIETFTIKDEVQVELCPLLYSSSDTLVTKYIDRFRLTSVKHNQTGQAAFDPSSGTVLPYPSLNAQQQAAIQRYINRRSQYNKELDFGYLQATSDLFDPISTWLRKNNLTHIKPVLDVLITVKGHGSLDDTPALYMLKFLSVETFMALTGISGSVFTLKEGLSVLINKMASLVKNVHVNHELTGLKRNKDHQALTFKSNGSTRKQLCSKTIVAFPPLLLNLEKIISDLNSDEKSVLNQVKITKYASAAHHLPSLNRILYVESFRMSANNTPIVGGPIGNGQIVGLFNQSSKKLRNVYSSYSWIRGDYDTMPSKQELSQMSTKMDRTLQKMSKAPKKLHPIKASEYFPHAVPSSLKNGFYRKFDSIQGNKGLYYASTILTFERMNEALQMTESFVEKFFNTNRTE